MSTFTAQLAVLHTDCLALLANQETGSADAIITDPPYNLGEFMKSRQTNLVNMRPNNFVTAGWDNGGAEAWMELMDQFLAESARTLRKGGALIVFMSVMKVETIIGLAQKHGFYYKTTGVWHKTNPMPRNMSLHYINSTETWIYFVAGAKTGTFNNNGKALHDYIESGMTPKSEKLYGSHPTQKPLALMEHFVSTLTNTGDLVIDPFLGSGTVGVAAVNAGRRFIGCDTDINYCDIAAKRIGTTITVIPARQKECHV